MIIKCAGCKRKLWKYYKVGSGRVLRCHKRNITKMYRVVWGDNKVRCPCGMAIGIDKGSYIKMIGQNIDITVTSVLQTTVGKMIFGRYNEESQ